MKNLVPNALYMGCSVGTLSFHYTNLIVANVSLLLRGANRWLTGQQIDFILKY